jgi:hypothetical protein
MSTTEYVDVQQALDGLAASDIPPANIDVIEDFINHQAAEGIAEVSQDRQIRAFKTSLTTFVPDDFRLRGASESELKEILAAMTRSDYADGIKHKFRANSD